MSGDESGYVRLRATRKLTCVFSLKDFKGPAKGAASGGDICCETSFSSRFKRGSPSKRDDEKGTVVLKSSEHFSAKKEEIFRQSLVGVAGA